ncbi:hypothetical protein [Granulicella arctica]|uniref:hypothetical protein n=1 Tax=Granulicella arctica TaxID=940613 RepID=UPI0021E0BF64|nr:hypothetical protein [Granulicella arctica]
MSDTILALVLTITTLILMLIWVPMLQTVEVLARRYPVDGTAEMPNLVEEDSGPQFTGDVA